MNGGGGGGGGFDGAANHKSYNSDDHLTTLNTGSRRSSFLWSIFRGHQYNHTRCGSKHKDHRTSFSSFKFMGFFLFFFLFVIFYFNPLHTFSRSTCPIASATVGDGSVKLSPLQPLPEAAEVKEEEEPTGLQHIVFGIAASAKLWDKRKDYIKLWWRPGQMRGFVWLDHPVNSSEKNDLPALKISGNTSEFRYTNRKGRRSAIRISRIVSETFRLGLPNARWFVMGDDDTVFLPENLAGLLARFDHRQPYYIGSVSESHLQNIYFSYNMAFGGGGFAISRPLAAILAGGFQDRCLMRYPALYGSDDRIQACMAELGVPLTRHPGFHQYDIHGDLLGLLAAHPVAPLVSLHHLDVVNPIFPDAPSRIAALQRLFDGPVHLDSAAVVQQSVCYDVEKGTERRWTVSVAWGFAVLVVRGVMSPREMEMPARTFLNWFRRADFTAYAFNTRPLARIPCQKPFVYYLSGARYDASSGATITYYDRNREEHPTCKWEMPGPADLVDRIIVYKKADPALWSRAPRRNCCRVLASPKVGEKNERTMAIDVGMCTEGEISEAL